MDCENLPLELRGCYIPITLICGMERLPSCGC